MKDHDIEDCISDCFDEKEALIVPAKPKFTEAKKSMIFSDGDLKRLKESLYPGGPIPPMLSAGPPSQYVKALLARLEAAEAIVLDRVKSYDTDPLAEAWRKVSGK